MPPSALVVFQGIYSEGMGIVDRGRRRPAFGNRPQYWEARFISGLTLQIGEVDQQIGLQ
jgi:hypothetical protein